MCGELYGARTKPRGFTMVELLLAVAVGGLAALATMMVFSAQNRASSDHSSVVDSQQNARAAMDEIVRDLREAGANLDKFHKQSGLVDAAPYQIVFNGDTRSGYGGDPAMESNENVPLWDGSNYSPGDFNDENLEDLSHFNNGAETVRLTLDVTGDGTVTEADTLSTTEIKQDFQLVRQVNGGALETVAYGLRGPLDMADGTKPTPVFQYWGEFAGGSHRMWGDTNSDGELSQSEIVSLTPVSRAEIKNVREITVTIQTLADMAGGEEAIESSSQRLTATVRPRNIGLNSSNLSACGYPPLPPTAVTAIDTPEDGGRSITLTFNAAFDDINGESDVREYSIYRRRVGQSSFGAAIYSMKAAKSTTYAFVNDQQHSVKPEDAPEDGVAYEYHVTSWDCEPQESNPSSIAGPVVSLPNGPIPPTITAAFDTPCDEGDDITVSFSASPDDQSSQGTFTGYRLYRGTSPGITAYKVRVLDISATNSTSYTVHDLSNTLLPMSADSTYYYVVRALRNNVESVDSNQWGPVPVSDGLASPVLTTVEDLPGDFGQRLLISWVPSPSEACPIPNNVAYYEVRRMGQNESYWNHVYTVTPLVTPVPLYTWTDSMVTPETETQYKIVARSGSGDVAESNVKSGRGTAENELQPPLALNVADEPCDPLGAVRVNWIASPSDAVGDITHYRILRGTQPGVYTYELPWVEAVGNTSYSILDDQNASGSNAPQLGTTYYYCGKSWNDYYSLLSASSNSSSVLAESTPTAPDIASVLDTPNDGGRSITVVFQRSEHDGVCDNTVDSYKVFRGTSAGAINVQVGSMTALELPAYTFMDNLVFSLDPPSDGVAYFYAVRAYADELVSQQSNIGGPVTSIRDGSVNENLFTDNFELDRGWTHGTYNGSDDWRISTPQGRHGSSYGNPDPATAYSGVKCAGTKFGSSSGLYGRDSKMWLESPLVDCRNASNIKLVFQRWLNVERSSRDKADIEIKVGSGSWTRVWRNPSAADVTDNQWSQFELDVTAQAAGFNNVKVRFVIESNSSRDYTGWNIDDFTVVKF